ncbi:hypothetical protein ALC62_12717 [Cyphomyrmex costatus]|uniref:Uncharacterized protein n=1 Tax=Cyphomyrmex costatus TaxID=456900 RepID=A0A151IAQ2_9HYME|nr:hypothetical protein ALC62_12717 [Cyphomyrmex costatus]
MLMIEQVIERSIETEKLFNEKIGFSSLDELYAKLKERIDLQKWIVSRRDNILYILNLIYLPDNSNLPLSDDAVKLQFSLAGFFWDAQENTLVFLLWDLYGCVLCEDERLIA